MEPIEVLQRFFGHDTFRPGQEDVIRRLLSGRSTLALFPTGAGKSLCYQLPALMVDGLTLVVSPLIALMKDQVESLMRRGIPAARLDSTLSVNELREIESGLERGAWKLLYVSPERLASEAFVRRLRRQKISILAVDEAHCISEWGHNFRPDYLRLPKIARELGISCVLTMTATATVVTAEKIGASFGIPEQGWVRTSADRPNLRYRLHACEFDHRDENLLSLLKDGPAGATIIYVTLRETTERVAGYLSREGLPARAYHAGMRSEDRAEVQDGFLSGELPIVVATVAFGMGVDKPDVRRVIHYNLPKSIENFVQETGRAGRDGLPAVCDLIACADDLTVLENFVYADTPSDRSLRSLIDYVLRQEETFSLSLYDLSVSLDIRQTVIETALSYLEMEGWITPVGVTWDRIELRMTESIEAWTQGFPPEEKELLRRLLATGKKGRLWMRFDIADSAATLGEDESRVRALLQELAVQEGILTQRSGVREVWHRVEKDRPPVSVIADSLVERFLALEQSQIDRLHQFQNLCENGVCVTQQLLRYFGEESEPCGTCSACCGESTAGALPVTQLRAFSLEDIALIQAVRKENHPALRQPRQLARFLCGLSSPAVRRGGLMKDDRFGALSEIPFSEVLAQIEA